MICNKALNAYLIKLTVQGGDLKLNEIIKQAIISIFTGFGGILAIYALIKFVIKKWLETTIEKQMQKALADYQKIIDRQNSSYNLRLQKEFDYFDLVQVQRYTIVSNTTLFLSYMKEKNSKGITDTGIILVNQFDDFIEKYKNNEAYLSDNIRELLHEICTNISEFAKVIVSAHTALELQDFKYEEIADNLIDSCENFRKGLIDYLMTKEN